MQNSSVLPLAHPTGIGTSDSTVDRRVPDRREVQAGHEPLENLTAAEILVRRRDLLAKCAFEGVLAVLAAHDHTAATPARVALDVSVLEHPAVPARHLQIAAAASVAENVREVSREKMTVRVVRPRFDHDLTQDGQVLGTDGRFEHGRHQGIVHERENHLGVEPGLGRDDRQTVGASRIDHLGAVEEPVHELDVPGDAVVDVVGNDVDPRPRSHAFGEGDRLLEADRGRGRGVGDALHAHASVPGRVGVEVGGLLVLVGQVRKCPAASGADEVELADARTVLGEDDVRTNTVTEGRVGAVGHDVEGQQTSPTGMLPQLVRTQEGGQRTQRTTEPLEEAVEPDGRELALDRDAVVEHRSSVLHTPGGLGNLLHRVHVGDLENAGVPGLHLRSVARIEIGETAGHPGKRRGRTRLPVAEGALNPPQRLEERPAVASPFFDDLSERVLANPHVEDHRLGPLGQHAETAGPHADMTTRRAGTLPEGEEGDAVRRSRSSVENLDLDAALPQQGDGFVNWIRWMGKELNPHVVVDSSASEYSLGRGAPLCYASENRSWTFRDRPNGAQLHHNSFKKSTNRRDDRRFSKSFLFRMLENRRR